MEENKDFEEVVEEAVEEVKEVAEKAEAKAKETIGDISKSKQKRIDRRKENDRKKRSAIIWKIAGIVVALAVLGVIIFFASKAIIKAANTITPSSDFSAQTDDNGFIKGVKASNYVIAKRYIV